MKKKYLLILLLLSNFTILGCDQKSNIDLKHVPNNPICKFSKVKLSFNKQGQSLDSELACSNEQKMNGLMNRSDLSINKGMLFVFDEQDYLSFWMKDTNIPLSIAFIDKNWNVVDIRDMKAFDEKSIISKSLALYAVEANLGWFNQQHIKIGDKVYLDLN